MHESALHVSSNSQGARVVESERAVGVLAALCNTILQLGILQRFTFCGRQKMPEQRARAVQLQTANRLRERMLLRGIKGMRSERSVLVLACSSFGSRIRGRASGALATANGLRERVLLCVDEGMHSKRGLVLLLAVRYI